MLSHSLFLCAVVQPVPLIRRVAALLLTLTRRANRRRIREIQFSASDPRVRNRVSVFLLNAMLPKGEMLVRAERCEGMAEQAKDRFVAWSYREMAKQWRTLVVQKDLLEHSCIPTGSVERG